MSSAEWKKKNYTKSIKVSEATVAKLRQGTKASNIAAANKPGASAEFREAVRRFYGAGVLKATPMANKAVAKSAGVRKATSPKPASTSKPSNPPTNRGMSNIEKIASVAGAAGAAAMVAEGLTKGNGKHVKSGPTGKHKATGVRNKLNAMAKSPSGRAEPKHGRSTGRHASTAPKHSASRSGAANKMKAQGRAINTTPSTTMAARARARRSK